MLIGAPKEKLLQTGIFDRIRTEHVTDSLDNDVFERRRNSPKIDLALGSKMITGNTKIHISIC